MAATGAAATVTHLNGTLVATKPDGTTRILARNSEVAEGEVVSTASGTYARLKFTDGGEFILRPNSQVRIEAYRFDGATENDDNVTLELIKGGVRSITGLIGKRNPSKYRMKAQNATIGIRGTNFGALLCQNDCQDIPTVSGKLLEDGLHVDVAKGMVSVENKVKIQVVAEGQFAYVMNPTTPPVLVPPQEGVRVTLPVFMTSDKTYGGTVGKGREDTGCVIQ